MKAIVVTDKAAGTAGVKLVERPEPQAAINDVVVQIHASGFTGDYGDIVTDEMARAHRKVVSLALNGAQTERKPSLAKFCILAEACASRTHPRHREGAERRF